MKAFNFCAVIGLALVSLTVAAQHLGPVEVAKLPSSAPTIVEAYGPDPLQSGELRLPSGRGPFPVAIIIHGGCFTKGFATLSYMAPIASALTQQGIATWNIEYREVGDAGGGWPGSFQDWAAATDHVRNLAKRYPLDLTRVIAVGHSAGASAALWIAGRQSLPRNSEIRGGDPLRLIAAFAIDGPADLAGWIGADAKICGKPVIAPLLGGTPAQVPEHYAQGNPRALLPLGTPQFLIASSVLTDPDAMTFKAQATAKGDAVTVLTLKDAGHFDMLSPANTSWTQIEQLIRHSIADATH